MRRVVWSILRAVLPLTGSCTAYLCVEPLVVSRRSPPRVYPVSMSHDPTLCPVYDARSAPPPVNIDEEDRAFKKAFVAPVPVTGTAPAKFVSGVGVGVCAVRCCAQEFAASGWNAPQNCELTFWQQVFVTNRSHPGCILLSKRKRCAPPPTHTPFSLLSRSLSLSLYTHTLYT